MLHDDQFAMGGYQGSPPHSLKTAIVGYTMTKHDDKLRYLQIPDKGGESFLRTLRELLGDISQEELARRISVSAVTVSRWERGKTPTTLTLPQLKALLRELQTVGMTFEDLPDSFAPIHQKKDSARNTIRKPKRNS